MLVEPRSRWKWAVLVVLAMAGAGIEALGALVVFYLTSWLAGTEATGVLGEYLPAADSEGLPTSLVVSIGVFFLVRGAFSLFLTWFQSRTIHTTAARISDRLFRRYLAAPYQLYLHRSSTELMRNALSSVEGVAARFLTPLVTVVTEAIVVLVLVVLLAVTAPIATLLVAAILGLASLVLMRLVRPRLSRYGKQAEEATRTSLATIQQSFNEARTIRILGRQRYFADAFAADRLRFAESRLHSAVLSKLPRVSIETAVFLMLVAFLGVVSIVDPVGSIGLFGLFGYAALRIMPGLNQIVSGLNLMRYGQASIDNVVDDLRGEEAGLGEAVARRERLTWSALSLDCITFRYEPGAPAAVEEASLTLRRGEVLGLVGQTGSGKSTLIDLILGLLEPTEGRIEIDGHALADVREGWQANIGLVPQDIHLLDDSIVRNVAFGVPDSDIDRSRVVDCLHVAQLSDFVARAADGVETRIGERGTSLSGGERQRIAIARALYSSPTLLILDEGTSAIDTATEASLVQALDDSGSIDTVIIVSHRASSLRICNRVAIMSRGHLVDRGDPEELMSDLPLGQSSPPRDVVPDL